jgi:hypothetical protein
MYKKFFTQFVEISLSLVIQPSTESCWQQAYLSDTYDFCWMAGFFHQDGP